LAAVHFFKLFLEPFLGIGLVLAFAVDREYLAEVRTLRALSILHGDPHNHIFKQVLASDLLQGGGRLLLLRLLPDIICGVRPLALEDSTLGEEDSVREVLGPVLLLFWVFFAGSFLAELVDQLQEALLGDEEQFDVGEGPDVDFHGVVEEHSAVVNGRTGVELV
jgi:hypothetical protein